MLAWFIMTTRALLVLALMLTWAVSICSLGLSKSYLLKAAGFLLGFYGLMFMLTAPQFDALLNWVKP